MPIPIEPETVLSDEELAEIDPGPFQPDSPYGRAVTARILMGIATVEEVALFTPEQIEAARLQSLLPRDG